MLLYDAYRQFDKYFKLRNFKEFMDPELTYLSGTPKIDIYKFDDYLHDKYGNYEDKNQCMAQFIETQYGKDALNFIKKII